MARKKFKRKKNKNILDFARRKKPKSQNGTKTTSGLNLAAVLKILTVALIVAAIVWGLFLLDKYVKTTSSVSEKTAELELINVPEWVTEDLKEKIISAVPRNGDLKPDGNAAKSAQQNIEKQVAWLEEVRVQTTSNGLQIKAKWRKPLALIKRGLEKFYVDSKLVVLDYVPMPKLPIVEVQGLHHTYPVPQTGSILYMEDLAAAVEILTKLGEMDKLVTPQKPLLYEIDRIDISNFNGRRNERLAHIIMYTADNTEIIWGARIGAWQRYLEAPDEEKLAKLYGYYQQYGTLSGRVKYINLCEPKNNVFQPIDKY